MKNAPSFIPPKTSTITAHLWFDGNCEEAFEYYQRAFGLEVVSDIVRTPDEKYVWYCKLGLNESSVIMADVFPGQWEKAPNLNTTASFYLYVDDCDTLFHHAVANECIVMMDLVDTFWGDRIGKLKDPFGHVWTIATWKFEYTPEEIVLKRLELNSDQKSN
jgi:PhnB protein